MVRFEFINSRLEYRQVRLCASQRVTRGGTCTSNNSKQRKVLGRIYDLKNMYMQHTCFYVCRKQGAILKEKLIFS